MHKSAAALCAVALVAGAGFLLWPRTESFVPPVTEEQKVTVFFAGDIMLDRNVAARAEEFGVRELFASTTQLFLDADLAVANLEGTITNNVSIARRDSSILRFTFDPDFAHQALGPLRLGAVSLANNHALDFYERGLMTTREYLDTWGVAYFGHPQNVEQLSARFDVRGKTICLVGYHGLYEAGLPAGQALTVIEEIKRIRSDCWRLVVMAHWGLEYKDAPEPEVVAIARRFIDAGADLVVGAHPHVVQPLEVYGGKAIFYSLGNFMFDQDFSWETTHGLGLRVEFLEGETRFLLIPTSVVYSRSAIAAGDEKVRILERVGVPSATFALPVAP